MKLSAADEIVSVADSDSTMQGFIQPTGLPENSGPGSTVAGYKSAAAKSSTPATPMLAECGAQESDTDPLVGTTVDSFLIESVIASGGMGTVYKALQQKPVRRHVALKMIRQGMADESTVNRFFVERQTLALMDHPDIARVYEAGTTPSGNPYFAMEYCEGQPIDQYCDQRSLGLTQRVELIIRIARAVQRAHAHGIVHRDLKPGNILVSDCEGRPNLKVIDFGIAKFTDQDQYSDMFGRANDHATRIGEMVGTPAYMSPEQAAGATIDARTDVFAIGAILFKLLTGSTPLAAIPEDCDSLADMILHIQSFHAIPPTRRLAESDRDDQEMQANQLGFNKCSQLLGSVKGDLDWVTLRATESNKLRRYATADDFADDLQRFLDHEPVVAAAPSRVYRFKKFYQRRRSSVIAASAVMVTILISIAIGGVSWWRSQQEDQAISARKTAEVLALLDEADDARTRAEKPGSNTQHEFVTAQTAVAKIEGLMEDLQSNTELNDLVKQSQARIRDDQAAFDLVAQLNDARERATQVDPSRSGDAFGRSAGLQRLEQAFSDFGLTPIRTLPATAAKRLMECPKSTLPKLIESMDFLINEDPIGAGLYLHCQGGRVTVAEVVEGGAAAESGQIRVGDRLLRVNGVDLIESFSADEIRVQSYRLLAGTPGSRVKLRFVRGQSDVLECELNCGGDAAHWAQAVLETLDPNPWRSELRRAALAMDLITIRQLSKSDELASQQPFSLIQLAGTLFLLERSNESIRFLELAQQRHPANFWANHYLGTALVSAHQPPRPEESLRYLTAAVSLRPKSPGARTNLVESLIRAGDHVSALGHAQVAAKLTPHYEPLKQRVASLSELNEKPLPSNSPFILGSAATNTSPTDEFRLESKPSSLGALEQLESHARVLAAKGDRDGALSLVRQADSKFPGDSGVRRMKGVVLIDLGDYVAARVVLSDAARSNPMDAAARFYYGVALQYAGNSEAAIHEYEAALQIRPDYTAVHDFLDPLRAAFGHSSR